MQPFFSDDHTTLLWVLDRQGMGAGPAIAIILPLKEE